MQKLLKKIILSSTGLKTLHNKASKNKLCIHKDNEIKASQALLKNNVIEMKGKNNRLQIGNNSRVYGCTVDINGQNNQIDIAKNVTITQADIKLWGDNNRLIINEQTTFNLGCQIKVFEGTEINIGRQCMISYNVDMRSSDGHPIFDKRGERINKAKDILIEDHVWIGSNVQLLKGTAVKKDSVVATGSLVTKAFNEENIIIAGRPAELLKREIHWKREL